MSVLTDAGSGSLGTQLVESPENSASTLQGPTSITAALSPRAPGNTESLTLELAQRGVMHIRDFAFDDGDERRDGRGSVLPSLKAASDAPPLFIAMYDFRAESSNELSVASGTQLHVLRDIDGGWVLAQRLDEPTKRGLVPGAYLQKL
ncbi:uncharacterized protein MJAP1_003330 [Malassezia japonica]|uniref:SH3 domain-containing protein n=1 Tax=Malassezia japonica TaxID=223818 RepID=A0AAF0F4E1_9BASI|nr:uncharacterized protein MJAP1_003330 [Malassezia japonica]WFD40344.1 hypothetical protein MJAP1_003330 [Malassezia japonica]